MPRTVVLAERESSFVATVQENAPYQWSALDFSLDLIGSLRLSQITYFPPTSEELQQYEAIVGTAPVPVYSVRAVVRTLSASNKVEDFVLACFPLQVSRLTDALHFTAPVVPTLSSKAGVPSTTHSASGTPPHTAVSTIVSGPSPRPPSVTSLLPKRRDAFKNVTNTFLLPCTSDVATGLDVHIELDGSTELRVEGPGTVVFSGEEKIGVLSPGRRAYTFY